MEHDGKLTFIGVFDTKEKASHACHVAREKLNQEKHPFLSGEHSEPKRQKVDETEPASVPKMPSWKTKKYNNCWIKALLGTRHQGQLDNFGAQAFMHDPMFDVFSASGNAGKGDRLAQFNELLQRVTGPQAEALKYIKSLHAAGAAGQYQGIVVCRPGGVTWSRRREIGFQQIACARGAPTDGVHQRHEHKWKSHAIGVLTVPECRHRTDSTNGESMIWLCFLFPSSVLTTDPSSLLTSRLNQLGLFTSALQKHTRN